LYSAHRIAKFDTSVNDIGGITAKSIFALFFRITLAKTHIQFLQGASQAARLTMIILNRFIYAT